ncbi:MAG: AMP-binding protein [Candidatus Micrarchaeota archaeon]
MGLKNLLDAGLIIAGMKRNQWKSRAELESLQEERLLKLLAHAKSNVPFYRNSLRGATVRSLEDLSSLPALGKSAVKNAAQSFIPKTCDPSKIHIMYTSGSTGTPITLFFDKTDSLYGSALRFHTLTECGFGPKDMLANLSATHFTQAPFQRFFYRIENLSPHESEERVLSGLRAIRASSIFAFPSTLSLLAGQNLMAKKPLRMRLAISCSEFLSKTARSIIARSFMCDVRDYYGSSESWSLGFECEKGSLHLNSDSVIMEIVDDEGMPQKDGKAGHVLITSLWRYSMPFIRYRIGDIASMGKKCPCGRGLHVISSLDGRQADVVVLPSGRMVPWASIQIPLSEMPGLLRFQCVQETRDKLRISAIPISSASTPGGKTLSEKDLIKAVLAVLPEAMDIDVAFVESIPRSSSGKMRDFTSKLSPSS